MKVDATISSGSISFFGAAIFTVQASQPESTGNQDRVQDSSQRNDTAMHKRVWSKGNIKMQNLYIETPTRSI
jgi:hypothetical protein